MSRGEMNEIEQMFYEAFKQLEKEGNEGIDPIIAVGLEIQEPVGIYRPDFKVGHCVVEIDGHEHHKTKEQREHDYNKDRYYLRNGYVPIRFTGTEVYLRARECVLETADILQKLEWESIDNFQKGYDCGVRSTKENAEQNH